jgi:hypothetical protein
MPLPSNLPNLFSMLELVLRLRDACPVFNRNVGGGLEFKADNIPAADKHLPYAFVVPIDTVGKQINRTEWYQSREGILGIVICVDGTKHKARADGINPVETVHSFAAIQAALEDCLLRWQPTGFVLDDIPTFERVHPLGASESRAYVMVEYAIPFRFYHPAYGGAAALKREAFDLANPNFRASAIKELLVHYKAEKEFPEIIGERYLDHVPFPFDEPSAEVKDAFREKSDVFDIDQRVLDAVEDRRLGALSEVEQAQDRPFPPAE